MIDSKMIPKRLRKTIEMTFQMTFKNTTSGSISGRWFLRSLDTETKTFKPPLYSVPVMILDVIPSIFKK